MLQCKILITQFKLRTRFEFNWGNCSTIDTVLGNVALQITEF